MPADGSRRRVERRSFLGVRGRAGADRERARRPTNQATDATTAITTMYCTMERTGSTRSHRERSTYPAPIITAFQTAEPMIVQIVKGTKGIRRNPAGIEIRDRINGMHRPTSTATRARRSNQRSARAMSAGAIRSHRPCRTRTPSSRCGPIHAATP